MYAGCGGRAASSPNSVGHEQEMNPDIPEWKKMLILKKRAACGGGISNAEEKASSSPYESSTRSHSTRVPVSAAGDFKSVSLAPVYPNKLAVVRPVKVEGEGEKVVIPFSINAGETSILSSNTVTRIFGNINVELRNVHRSNPELPEQNFEPQKMENSCPERYIFSSDPAYAPEDSEHESEDLQYGPGIVDKLRCRFLNMGRKNLRKPVVRRFSSLENLSDRNVAGRLSTNGQEAHGAGQELRSSTPYNMNNRYVGGRVKKAQSMETLLIRNPEQHLLLPDKPSRRVAPRSPCVSGVRSQIARATPSPENSSPSGNKVSRRRCDYGRQVSAPNINEDELPKPDTVKHFKMMFESPSEKTSSHGSISKKNAIQSPPTSVNKLASGAILFNNNNTPTHKPEVCRPNENAKSSAKAVRKSSPTLPNGDFFPSGDNGCLNWNGKDKDFPEGVGAATISEDGEVDGEIIKDMKVISDLSLSQTASGEVEILSCDADVMLDVPSAVDNRSAQQVPLNAPPPGVTCETEEEGETPSSQEYCEDEGEKEPAQGSRVAEPERQTTESNTRPHPQSLSHYDMVAASQDREDPSSQEDSPAEMCVLQAGSPADGTEEELVVATLKPSGTLKKKAWQKPPPSTTTVVFDFRGKDVKPNISLNPAPFGCRPAKVARGKRAGSPPRSSSETLKINGDRQDYSDDDDDDGFDEMDIGAHLPAMSGIVFDGENVKIGTGAFLVKRNKNLTIQFDDAATSTYEYPSEATAAEEQPSPTPSGRFNEDARLTLDAGEEVNVSSASKSSLSLASSGGLSSYTPNVLSSEDDFQLGISRSTHRHTALPSITNDPQPSTTDDIVPADQQDITGWSAAETSDILF